jgi:hypothetical protein
MQGIFAQRYSAGLRAGWWGFDSRQGLGIFLFTTDSRSAIQLVRGALSLRVKRPGREAEHSHPSSAEIKNAGSYTSTPQYAFMAWCSVKRKAGNFLTSWVTVSFSRKILLHRVSYLEDVADIIKIIIIIIIIILLLYYIMRSFITCSLHQMLLG